MDVEINGARILYTIHTGTFLGDIPISETLVISWVVMLLLTALCIWLGHDLKVNNISKRQALAEFAVEALNKFVRGNMGEKFDFYIPLIGALISTAAVSNLISLTGVWSPTADLSTEAAWAIVIFVLITFHKIKASGIGGYLKGFLEPIFVLAPVNIIGELATPVSMACRHFGNILSGMVISTLIYTALAGASSALFGLIPGALGNILSGIPFLDVGIPAVAGLYFDWFSGCVQAFIFCTLATIFIKNAAGED